MPMISIVAVAISLGLYIFIAYRRGSWPFGKTAASELRRLGIPTPEIKYEYLTPLGVVVKSPVPVPSSALSTIDAALSELFRRYRAAFPNWTRAFSHSTYQILFVTPMGSTEVGGWPTILVRGTESAGTAIGFPFPMEYIVLAHQGASEWAYLDWLFHSVYNEGEHFIQSHNDAAVFRSHTGLDDVHPHVPEDYEIQPRYLLQRN